jgi:shikimate kinase
VVDAGSGHLVLIGMMGSGKTTVGRIVAERLGRTFLDSDEVIEARTGHTVRAIFDQQGEAAFRREESAALAEALAFNTPVVVAAAGGTVLDPTNRERMGSAGTVVWLRADPLVLADRVVGAVHRPLLDKDPVRVLRALEAQRQHLYGEVADVTIEVDELTPEQVADRIVEALEVKA